MRRIVFLLVLLLLGGCASVPPLNFTPPNVGVTPRKLDADLRSLTVTLARPDEKRGSLPAGMEGIVPTLWKEALTDSLDRMALFTDDAPRKVNLSVKILGVDVPAFGASFKTHTIARYELMDRATGDLIYTQDVASDGVVPPGYAFAGVTRARESVNRSVQNNILQFLQGLATVDVTRPMFPVAQHARATAPAGATPQAASAPQGAATGMGASPAPPAPAAGQSAQPTAATPPSALSASPATAAGQSAQPTAITQQAALPAPPATAAMQSAQPTVATQSASPTASVAPAMQPTPSAATPAPAVQPASTTQPVDNGQTPQPTPFEPVPAAPPDTPASPDSTPPVTP